MNNRPTKIFGIGLSKTGTSSLAQALERLGFRTRDCMGAARYVPGDLSSIDMETVLAHDALTDTPIPSFYRELDARFPGSKFILTVREREGWLKSCRKQFNERAAATQNDAHRRLFEDLYGTNAFDAGKFEAGYERFVAGVLDHFKGRPQDLLVLNVTAGDGWEKLCPFLGRLVPDMPFPKANVTQIRWMNIADLVSVAEAAGIELLKRFKGEVDPAARAGSGIRSSAAATVLDRALSIALGRDATESASQAAHKVIVAGLSKLNSGIPVLSPVEKRVDYAERKHWNHVWLVDPLDGREAFAGGNGDFSVNIALIEDGRPIYGVVHAPAKGITYYGRTGKGAYKRVGGSPAIRLSALSAVGTAFGPDNSTGSRSLHWCSLLEHLPEASPTCKSTHEWRVAAAHAVLSAADLCPVDERSAQEPSYNSQQLTVPVTTIRAREPA